MKLYLFFGGNFDDGKLPLFDEFRTRVYEPAFPEIDEREPFEKILDRLKSKDKSPQTMMVLAIEKGKPCGGLIADWYPGCRSLELIYIAVDPSCSRKGLGKTILNVGTAMMVKELGGNVACVYAEVENPFSEPESNGLIDPISRLRFFASQGAVRIPINYVQPPLDSGQGYVTNLFLLCFPSFVEGMTDRMPAKNLDEFLTVFYDGLKENADNKEEFYVQLSAMKKQVFAAADSDDNIIFDHLVEKPSFKIPYASVGCHYTINVHPDDSLWKDRTTVCPNFDSYETDLLNYRHQTSSRPLYTHHVPLKENMRILLPQCYEYSSEGLTFFRLTSRSSIRVDISLNWSFNASSEKFLAHIVLSPVYGENADYFDELDLIRFIAGFGSCQERFHCIGPDSGVASGGWEGFRIEGRDGTVLSVEEWIREMLGIGDVPVSQGTGYSEINLFDMKDAKGQSVFGDFDSFRLKILDEKGPDAGFHWNRVMCGLVLGIFDFERMSSPEIYDTVRPMVERKDSFMVLNRGHLMEISYSNNPENEKDEDIIASPYVLIPSAALAFNECLLKENTALVDEISAGEREFAKNRFKENDNKFYSKGRELQRQIQLITKNLNDGCLDDIFQYVSEQDILRLGSTERGLTGMRSSLEKKLDDLRESRDYYLEEYKNGFNMNQSMILLVLAILQVVTAILAGSSWWITVAVSLSLLLLFYIYGRLHIRKTRRN